MSRRRRKRGPESAASRRKRPRHADLTPEQRRREIVDLLAAALAEMPPALSLGEGTAASVSPTLSPNSGPENSQESSQKALELSAETRLSVSGYDGH